VVGALHSVVYISDSTGVVRTVPLGVYYALVVFALGSLTGVSGYAIGHRYSDLTEPVALRRFLYRRAVRIYPLYAIACTVFWLAWNRNAGLPWLAAQYAGVGVLFSGSRAGLPSIQTLWYAQIILIAYGAYALVASRRSRALRWAAAIGILLVVAVWSGVLRIGDPRLLVYAPAFVFGAALPFWPRLMPSRGAGLAVSVLVLCPTLGLLLMRASSLPAWGIVVLQAIAGVAVLGPAWWAANHLARLMRPGLVSSLAYGSFGAYLFHRPVFSVILRVVPAPLSLAWAVLLFSVVGTALAFLTGFLLQTAYDSVRRRFEGRATGV
jgi:peptidoglycan/LPS O-acetylase OafA/YrhL